MIRCSDKIYFKKAKFITNIINNSLKKCWQIMKISKNKYLKSLSPIYKIKNLVKIKYVTSIFINGLLELTGHTGFLVLTGRAILEFTGF